jgi:drug/metabolite transporter (DMT)-like permease
MTQDRSAIVPAAISPLSSGTVLAGLGVLGFSLSFPATVWALGGFGPWTVTGLRGLTAAALALTALVATRAPLPARADRPALAVVAGGCVLGFPLLTTLALQTTSTADSAVIIGALPMTTATISALITRRRPSKAFWAAAATGAATVVAFSLSQNRGHLTLADLYLFLALLVCAAGYAYGGRLSAHLPGWRVIAWGIVLAAPAALALTAWALPHEPVHPTAKAVAGMAYIAGISQFGGFVVWYKGMGMVGVAKASQLQLAQPLLTLAWSALLLGEHIAAGALATAVVVLVCIVVTQRARVR